MTWIRSVVFLLGGVLVTAIFGIFIPLLGLFGYRPACALARVYGRIMLAWCTISVRIRYEVRGWENVPAFPVVFMSKHQSAWETLFMDASFGPQCWIVKKELLWLPFVGWSLLAIRCIAIDRSSGHSARDQIIEQGARRLKQGMWVSIFPEGTRVAPGKRGRYGIGGALLAVRTGTPILPMAHNAGEVWPRNSFRKRPGLVTVVIGPVIPTAGRDAVTVNNELEAWIEGRMREISPERYADA